jgi:hypothetical protein
MQPRAASTCVDAFLCFSKIEDLSTGGESIHMERMYQTRLLANITSSWMYPYNLKHVDLETATEPDVGH